MTLLPFFPAMIAGYFIALLLYFIDFEQKNDPLLRWAQRSALAGIFFHAAHTLAAFRSSEPRSWTSFYAVSLLAVAVCYALERRSRARFLMLFCLPTLMAMFAFAALQTCPALPPGPKTVSPLFWLHLALSGLGFAGLFAAACAAIMYLLQSSLIKSKRVGRASGKLPSLETLDRVHFVSLFWGGALFSVGAVTGFFLAKGAVEPIKLWKDPLSVYSLAICPAVWAVLLLRLSSIGRGRKIAIGTVLVFLVLFLAMITPFFCPAGFHKGL